MSFFDKLKQNIGIEGAAEEEAPPKKEEVRPKKTPERKTQRMTEKSPPILIEEKKEKKSSIAEEKLSQPAGQLAVDVYETPDSFIVQSTIAGVKGGNLDISIEKDVVVIKGSRENPNKNEGIKYLYQECYWGPFVREIILPGEIDDSQIKAVLKDGVLNLTLPKVQKHIGKKILVEEE